jgi:hypothetical protein
MPRARAALPWRELWSVRHALRRIAQFEEKCTMAYLEVSPMIAALRTCPSDFDMSEGRLRHIPSGHKVVFDPFGGSARIDGFCACATLQISRPQSVELLAAFREWKENHWRAVEINRDFAEHFQPSFLRRLAVRALTYLLEHHGHPAPARTPQVQQSAT